MRLIDDTAKLRRSIGADAVVGRRAATGRRILDAMAVGCGSWGSWGDGTPVL
jgi:hypothetical protein